MSDLDRENIPIQLFWYDSTTGCNYPLQVLTANSPYGATPTGLALFGKYESTPTVYSDGDAVPLAVDCTGKLLLASSVTIDYSYVDSSPFTIANCHVAAIGAIYEASASCVSSGDIGIPRMTIDRQLVMSIGSISTNCCLNIAGTVTACQSSGANLHVCIDGQPLGVCQATGSNLHTVVDSGNITICQGGNSVFVTSSNALKVDGSAVTQPISRNTTENSETNPLYVQVVEGTTSTIEKHCYGVTTIAKNASCYTACYVVPIGKTFLLTGVKASSSTAARFTVRYGNPSSYNTYAVAFSSSANPFVEFSVNPPLEVVGNGTNAIEITARNDGPASADFYGTIDGREI